MELQAQRPRSIAFVYLFVCLFVHLFVRLLVWLTGPAAAGILRAPPPIMAQGPPSSDSEDTGDIAVYQYESEGEEALGRSVRALFDEAGQDYRRKSFQY